MATVEDLPTGKVVGQFLFVSQDNADAGTKPNAVLVTGYVRFTCSASPILYYSKKVTAVPLVHDAVFDSEGYLMPMDTTTTEPGKVVAGKLERGMELLANAPGVNPEGFTWTATFYLKESATGRALSIPSFSFLLSAGETVDVADIFPVGASNGVLVSRGQSAYEVAVANGYTGTQAQWLTSLLAPKSVWTIGTVTASASGANPVVTVAGTAPNHTLSFVLPRGAQGIQGIQGPANTLSIGTVTASASGGAAAATITGTSPAQVLNLTIPRGEQGIQGIQGIQGAGVPTGGTANQVIQKNASNVAVWLSPTPSLVNLGNVNNTSDANKPVSTATQTALNAKENTLIDTGWVEITPGPNSKRFAPYLYVRRYGNMVQISGSIGKISGNYTMFEVVATVPDQFMPTRKTWGSNAEISAEGQIMTQVTQNAVGMTITYII